MRKHFNHYRPPAAGSRLRTSPSSPERRIGCSSVSHDVSFQRSLRMVDGDMKVKDYLDTGYLNTQIPSEYSGN